MFFLWWCISTYNFSFYRIEYRHNAFVGYFPLTYLEYNSIYNELYSLKKEDISAKEKNERLNGIDAGRQWLAEYKKVEDPWFYVSVGGGWFHYEGSWITKPDVPFGYLKSYIERLEKGERIERALEDIDRERKKIFAEYRKLIKTDEDRKVFDDPMS